MSKVKTNVPQTTEELNQQAHLYIVRLKEDRFPEWENEWWGLASVKPDPTSPPDGMGRWFSIFNNEGIEKGVYETDIAEISKLSDQSAGSSYNLSHATCQN